METLFLLCINVGWLGRVLMQFETCQSWIAELVSHFGSSSAILVFSFGWRTLVLALGLGPVPE